MSIITDFINRIRNRNRALPEGPQDASAIGKYDYNDVIRYMQESGGMDEFFDEMDKINIIRQKCMALSIHQG